MKYFGYSGWLLHDGSVSVIDEKGDIEFASTAERYTREKHDDYIPPVLWKKGDGCIIVSNEDWDYRHKVRPGKEIEDRSSWTDPTLVSSRPMWRRHGSNHPEAIPVGHHKTHASCAFATRPKSFAKEDCVIVTIDGIGEFESCTIQDTDFNILHSINFPKSLGYLWANFTEAIGMRANEDEYITMGLASYGDPKYTDDLLDAWESVPSWTYEDLDTEEYQSIHWENLYGNKTYIIEQQIRIILGGKKSAPQFSQEAADGAASLQAATNIIVREMMTIARKYGSKLCYSGGVAQNIVANSAMHDIFDDVWIDVNPGDGGASLGAAAYQLRMDTGIDRVNWEHPFLGYNIDKQLDVEQVVDYILKERVAGIANGRAEFSPRAYGNRSLIADVRYDVKDTVNEIKKRQKYRPFAPAILEEHADEYFEGTMNRWMQYTAKAKHDYKSVTHVDGSARVQLVPKDCHNMFRKVIECYYEKTGVPMLLNTSLNIRGMPMVNTEDDAAAFENLYNVKVF